MVGRGCKTFLSRRRFRHVYAPPLFALFVDTIASVAGAGVAGVRHASHAHSGARLSRSRSDVVRIAGVWSVDGGPSHVFVLAVC